MSLISIDECFSSPQPPNIKSERLKVKVKSQGASLTVAELKKAIVRKGYPSLCDASRITLILPVGKGFVLEDQMMASDLEHNSSLLALMSSSPREASHLHRDDGLNIPHILYVYHSSNLKTFIKFPHSVIVQSAGQWASWQTSWSASLPELVHQFTGIGFDHSLVTHELKRLEHRRLPEDLISSSHHGAGVLAPSLIFRLWDASGLNRLVNSQKQTALRGRFAPSEFEVFSASSNFSVESDTTEGTVLGISPPCSPGLPSTSSLVHQSAPSVIMASPSEHESAYDDVFYQSFSTPTPTVHGSDCSSESGRSELRSLMDWTSGQSAAPAMSTSSRLSKIIRKVGDLTRERDRLVADSISVKQSGSSNSESVIKLLEEQAQKFELERLKYNQELESLTSVNLALREEVEHEVRTVRDVFEAVNQLSDHQNTSTQNTLKTLREIKDNLSNVLTCSICCERFGSLSSNVSRRPIHLSCGHIFCANCLHQDWSHRASVGLEPQARCFNRCPNFDVDRLAEIYLLDDVKEVLELLPDINMET
ncbi:hypothetical protein MJO28_006005 [Puccinia striiformis f. sp. tritici]|uniref:Uncharacterized protein n=1 Tax=Puccinia striiformis f. sp. tritici TaxID=168172 RepID=A0ACC0EI12_9BASI|nr:hypothetical protein Pst134EB_012218 [Puccinia striiformis f. sp. tritici]KAI7953458.1 hypothetical protein MJO28_006005 [Puccinia striiformis f. sp. tritici]